MQYFYVFHWPIEGGEMSRPAVRRMLVIALLVGLVAPSAAVFAQYEGRRGFGGGGRMRRDWQRMMPQIVPQVVPVTPEEPKKEEKKDDKKDAPKLPEGPPPVTRPPGVENPAVLADQRMRVDDKKHEVSFNFQE